MKYRINVNEYYIEWSKDNKSQRLDGPAIEYYDGGESWYIDGIKYTFNKWIKNEI